MFTVSLSLKKNQDCHITHLTCLAVDCNWWWGFHLQVQQALAVGKQPLVVLGSWTEMPGSKHYHFTHQIAQ